MKRIALHWQILLGMILGVLFAVILGLFKVDSKFINDWIKPFGDIFIRLLKLIAIPLILASLIKGISDLKDISKFRRMGLRTIALYIITTIFAISIGLLVVNIFQPGAGFSDEMVQMLTEKYGASQEITSKIAEAEKQKNVGPLNFLVDMVPDNAFKSMSENSLMLQVIFFAIFMGISLLLIKEEQAKPIKDIFDSLNEVVLKMVDIIMLTAPYAVFALMATVVANSESMEILIGLLKYGGCVVLGLFLMIIFYMILVSVFGKKNPFWFISQISPAQLTALSTSSSAATLPVTLERVNEHVGVDEEVASFVLPVGATINMDGTSLYQAVAAVFVSQALMETPFGLEQQLMIVLTALLASIGSAAVPGAGMVMLIIVLESVNFPTELYPIALAMIFAIDRPLDMLRTTVNVTGDATVALLVGTSLGKIHNPKERKLKDYYQGEV